jgi:hypothetical protein
LGLRDLLPRRRPKIHPDDADAAVVEQLTAAGADLTQPRETNFYVYFPNEADARGAVADIAERGYTAKVEPSATADGTWLLLATRELVVDERAIATEAAFFDVVAREHGGDYDGWEAAV